MKEANKGREIELRDTVGNVKGWGGLGMELEDRVVLSRHLYKIDPTVLYYIS
jgi:hypothetical protein